jgi:hypothetical protein
VRGAQRRARADLKIHGVFFVYVSFSRTPAATREMYSKDAGEGVVIFGRAAVEKRAQPAVRSLAPLHE